MRLFQKVEPKWIIEVSVVPVAVVAVTVMVVMVVVMVAMMAVAGIAAAAPAVSATAFLRGGAGRGRCQKHARRDHERDICAFEPVH
jgi:hypothetical protein